jgi:hypothetical protein
MPARHILAERHEMHLAIALLARAAFGHEERGVIGGVFLLVDDA